MLAAHRDRENLVQGHQVPTKQQPKTPGTRFPKTPLATRNDENAPTAFAGKAGREGPGGARLGGDDKLTVKGAGKGPAMVTPMEARTRAPLGNKTTNAKARANRSAGVKDMVQEIERAQAKHVTAQKPKQKPLETAPVKLAVHTDQGHDSDGVDEPEYAPLQPAPLPYQSDVLPEGGLTFECLKGKRFLKGFYEHFHNPLGDAGVSREEKRLCEEMEALLKTAKKRNEREAACLDWNIEDLVDAPPARLKPGMDKEAANNKSGPQKQPPTISSKRAASALAMSSGSKRNIGTGPPPRSAPAKRPLSSLLPGSKTKKQPATHQTACSGNSTGEAASRTTIGYNKGRTASSMMHSRGGSFSDQAARPVATREADQELTMTPARIQQAAPGKESALGERSRPQFLSIFDDMDDEDLPPVRNPYPALDEDEEEFELKLTI